MMKSPPKDRRNGFYWIGESGSDRCRCEACHGSQTRVPRLRVYSGLPVVAVDIEHVAHSTLDLVALSWRRVGVVLQPMLGAKRLQHLVHRISAVLERHRRYLSPRTLVVRRTTDHAGDARG